MYITNKIALVPFCNLYRVFQCIFVRNITPVARIGHLKIGILVECQRTPIMLQMVYLPGIFVKWITEVSEIGGWVLCQTNFSIPQLARCIKICYIGPFFCTPASFDEIGHPIFEMCCYILIIQVKSTIWCLRDLQIMNKFKLHWFS